MENIIQKTEVSINAGSTVQQIEQSFKGLTLEDKFQVIRGWIEDEQDENFPVCFKNDEVYKNFMYYIFINCIDNEIDNSKPFIPGQDYEQEAQRIMVYLFPLTVADEVYTVSMKSNDEWLMDLYCSIDCAIQDRFFRKLKANEGAINTSDENKVTKLW